MTFQEAGASVAQPLALDRHGPERRRLDALRRGLGVGRLEIVVTQLERLVQLETIEALGAQVQEQLLLEVPVEREDGERAPSFVMHRREPEVGHCAGRG